MGNISQINPFRRLGYRRIMLKAESLFKRWTVHREAKLSRATVEFSGQSFRRGHYPPMYQQAGKGFIYFATLRLVSLGEHTSIVPVYFGDFFVFRFNFSNLFLNFPWPIRSLAWMFFRFLVVLPLKWSQTTDIKSDCGYPPVTVARFCITWSILSNEGPQK